ncbi:lipoxygenase family protein [Coleofasciculus sp. H7-2]|uniref:lipoxygenase family protein n=1 Tax=Coleofasciculus sp. H7-2 TaxID=3351545 RepID=UPI00366D8101
MTKTTTLIKEVFKLAMIKLLNTSVGKQKAQKKTEKQQSSLHKAVGQLVFADNNKPLHNIEVELWDRDIGKPDDYLGKGITDKDGKFEIYYDPENAGSTAGFKDVPDLELRLIEIRSGFNANNELVLSRKVAYIIKGQDNVTQQVYDFGTCTVPYWVYKPSSPFPRVLFTELEGSPDEDAIGRKLKGYEAANVFTPIKVKQLLENTLNPNKPSLAELQTVYPPNLTLQLEQKNPGYTRSDEYFGLRVLNGMNPCLLKRNKNNPNQYKMTFNWDAYEKDKVHDLNNVEAIFEVKDGKMLPTAITVQSRYPDSFAPFSPLKESVTYTPNDGEKWLQAKRIFRTNYLFAAELIEHYIKGHLQMEQYTIAAFRNLRKNPVRLMLIPHVKSVININQRADTVLVSEIGYVTSAGPLTNNSINQICHEVMSKLDWKGWKPRQPLTDSHTYAKVANLYWNILTEYTDVFFEKHYDEIVKEWVEIRCLSDDIVEHSVAYEPAKENNPKAGTDDYEWYDVNELDKPALPRYKVNGVLKAVRPITQSDQPNVVDIENLKQFCRYVIFHLTLWHSWVNDGQADDGGEIAYSSLGMRNGSFGSEDDPAIAPPISEAIELLYLANVLTATKYGYILKNEDGDIPEELRTILLGHRKDFAELGYDANNIRSLINI